MGCLAHAESRFEHSCLFPSQGDYVSSRASTLSATVTPTTRVIQDRFPAAWIGCGAALVARTRAVQRAQFMTHLAGRFAVMEFMTRFKPLKGDIYIISHFAQREAFLTFSSHPEGTACLLAPQRLRVLWHPLWEPHLFGGITGDTVLLQSQLSLPHPLSEQPQGNPGAEVRPRPWASGTLELIFATHPLPWQDWLFAFAPLLGQVPWKRFKKVPGLAFI